MNTQIESFAARLRAQFPDACVEIEHFPSSSYFLDFRWRGRLWVMEYSSPHQQFGVDEVQEDEGFNMGYHYVFNNFEAAQIKFLELLEPCNATNTLIAA